MAGAREEQKREEIENQKFSSAMSLYPSNSRRQRPQVEPANLTEPRLDQNPKTLLEPTRSSLTQWSRVRDYESCWYFKGVA